jgi:hypothetical protein
MPKGIIVRYPYIFLAKIVYIMRVKAVLAYTAALIPVEAL